MGSGTSIILNCADSRYSDTFRPRMKLIRILMLATFVAPLVGGSILMVFGAIEIWPARFVADNETYEELPDWVPKGFALALPVVSLCAIARPRRSEWAFTWLFVYGFSCLGLALIELHLEWERFRRFGVDSYWVTQPFHGPQRLMFVYSTVFLGIAQLVAAVWRVEVAGLMARSTP